MHLIFLALCLLAFQASSCQTAPVSKKSSVITLIPEGEPGKPFTLELTVLDLNSKQPIKDVEVFAYHTNYKGDYVNDANGVARIHGTAYSDDKGWMKFITIYPRGYNDSNTGEHIHFRVKAKKYAAGGADLSFWEYQQKRYDLENPVANKVYLQSLEENNGKLVGKAVLYLK